MLYGDDNNARFANVVLPHLGEAGSSRCGVAEMTILSTRPRFRMLALVAATSLAAMDSTKALDLLTIGRANTVTIGAAVQLTGGLAETGRHYRDAYQFTVDKINEKGGITVDGKKYKLALKLVDTKSDPKLVGRLYERLVTRQKVTLLLGPYLSSEVMVAASVAERHEVPMVQAGGASSRIFSRGYRYAFGTLPAVDDALRSTIAMTTRLMPDAKTVGVVSDDNSFDLALSNGTIALSKEAGLRVVLDQQYSERTPNFFNLLTLIEAKAPDVILLSGTEANAINFIRQAKSRNIHPKLLASFTEGVPSAGFRSALGKDANYAFGITPWVPAAQFKDRWFGDTGQFAGAYERKFGYAPDYHVAAAVAAVQTLALAVEKAGTSDPKQVCDAIARLGFESVYGRVRFGENGQIVLPQTVLQIQDGKLIEVSADKPVN